MAPLAVLLPCNHENLSSLSRTHVFTLMPISSMWKWLMVGLMSLLAGLIWLLDCMSRTELLEHPHKGVQLIHHIFKSEGLPCHALLAVMDYGLNCTLK